MRRRLLALAPAKINLGLEALGHRPDGYHEIATVLQTITLYDRLVWTDTGGPFEYVGPPDVEPATDLTLRALRLAPDFGSWAGLLTLEKSIPLAAGLGGGSSDAALALRIALPDAADDELRARAAELGADVPFFMRGGAALASGIGATLTSLPTRRLWAALVIPPLELPEKTRRLYQGLTPDDFTNGAATRALADRLRAGEPRQTLPPNAFERQLDAFPEVRYARTMLARAGAAGVTVSGAGPALYAAFDAWRDAARVAAALPNDVGRIVLARSAGSIDSQAARRIAWAARGRMGRG